MYKNAIEKINKFYDLDLEENAHADELFDVLNEVISFDSAAIFYLTPEKLTLEFGKNYEIYEDIILDEKTSKNLYNLDEPAIFPGGNNLCSRLIVKGAVFGVLVIYRNKNNSAAGSITNSVTTSADSVVDSAAGSVTGSITGSSNFITHSADSVVDSAAGSVAGSITGSSNFVTHSTGSVADSTTDSVADFHTVFTPDEKLIFNTSAKIISNLIKDLELSKILRLQMQVMEDGMSETYQAYETIKKQNKEIKASKKLQNQFIANVSHDLRTPLNAIISSSEILGERILGELNEKQREYINDIRISGIKLLTMINEILDISKIESHTLKLNLSRFRLSQAITEVCNIIAPLAEKKSIKVTQNIDNNIELTGDYVKFQQILLNILSNSLKYAKSEIQITTAKTTKEITISIKDDGLGIDKKFHKKIFNKFFQIEDNLNKTETSTGLGLAIVKEFVKLHNGKIKVESQPNKNTTFIITFPNN